MKLSQILNNIVDIDPTQDCVISDLCLDSRQVKPGDLFMAYCGGALDGRNYIPQAITKGATAILAEAEGLNIDEHDSLTIIPLKGLNQKIISQIAARFYAYPSHDMKMIAVTGTNGKTSCSCFIAQTLSQPDEKCAVVGTLGYGFSGSLQESNLTTPDPITLQRLLYNLKQQGAQSIVMEASSHALVQGRMQDIEFDIGIFTNLTQDHLDFHGDMASYGAAKQLLFTQFNLSHAVINIDDPFGCNLIQQLPPSIKCFSYALEQAHADVTASEIQVSRDGLQANVKTPWGEGNLQSALIGRFNLSNLLAVLTVLNIFELSFYDSLNKIAALTNLPGRMQVFNQVDQPLIIVDFAHTPDALASVLRTLQEINKGDIYCVFGCGGDRDQTKRPLMGQQAEQLADHLIITNDNPRFEEAHAIVADILAGIKNHKNVIVEYDRKKAIQIAITQASADDIVLIAGKGHESYQLVGEQKIPFNDAECVGEMLVGA